MDIAVVTLRVGCSMRGIDNPLIERTDGEISVRIKLPSGDELGCKLVEGDDLAEAMGPGLDVLASEALRSCLTTS